jgi:AmmeMemoRadiSam system protein A
MGESHPLVELARRTIEVYVTDGRQIRPPQEIPPEMRRRAGAFVTIHLHGRLRGCIGTIEPTCDNLVEEVIRNAVAAATRDPRFSPIRRDELAELNIKVDVLGQPEVVNSLAELDPVRYGLIVQSVSRPWVRGLLLPDLAGIDTVEKQVKWTRERKAGITDPDEPVEMLRFEVHRYT